MEQFREEHHKILKLTDAYWSLRGHTVHTKYPIPGSAPETYQELSVLNQTVVNDEDNRSDDGKGFMQMLTDAETNRKIYGNKETPLDFDLVTSLPRLLSEPPSRQNTTADSGRPLNKSPPERSGRNLNQAENTENTAPPRHSSHQEPAQLKPDPNPARQPRSNQDHTTRSLLPKQSAASVAGTTAGVSRSKARKNNSTGTEPRKRKSRAKSQVAGLTQDLNNQQGPAFAVPPPLESKEKLADSLAKQQDGAMEHNPSQNTESRKGSIKQSFGAREAIMVAAMPATAGASEEVDPRSRAGRGTEDQTQTRKRRAKSVTGREILGTPPRAMKGQDMIEEINRAAEEAAKHGVGRITRGDKRKEEAGLIKDEEM